MALSNLQIQTEAFTVRGEEVSLRGLCFDDLAYLLADHREDLDRLVNKAREDEEQDAQELVMDLLREAPDLAAKVIACAAGEPDMAHIARRLAFPTQMEMLMAIGRLTFEEVGGVKKFLESVVAVLRAGRTTLSDLRQPESPKPGTTPRSTGSSS